MNEAAIKCFNINDATYLNIGMDNDPVFTLTDYVWRDKEEEPHAPLSSTVDSPKRYALGHFGTQVRLDGLDDWIQHSLLDYYMPQIEKKPPLLMEVWEDQIYSRWDHYWDVQFAFFKFYGENCPLLKNKLQFLDLLGTEGKSRIFDQESFESLFRRGKLKYSEEVQWVDTAFRTITSEGIIYLLSHACETFLNLEAFQTDYNFTDLEVHSLFHFIESCSELRKLEVDIRYFSVNNQINFYKHLQKHKNYKRIFFKTKYSLDFKSLYFNSKNEAELFIERLSRDDNLRNFVMSLGNDYKSLLRVNYDECSSTIFWNLDKTYQEALANFYNS